jgi:hypothetical protein
MALSGNEDTERGISGISPFGGFSVSTVERQAEYPFQTLLERAFRGEV